MSDRDFNGLSFKCDDVIKHSYVNSYLIRSSQKNQIREIIMNWNQVEGNWKQLKGSVKAQWGQLTDDHLEVIAGKRDQLAGKIQETYGVTQEEAEKQISEWQKMHVNK